METALSTSALVTASLLRPFAGEDGQFKAPGIDEFVGLPALFFEGTPFEINRIIMVRLIALAIMVLLMYLALRKSRLVPTRGQGAAEMALDFVRVHVAPAPEAFLDACDRLGLMVLEEPAIGWVDDTPELPARLRHRVSWTTPDEPTVWLAVFSPPA